MTAKIRVNGRAVELFFRRTGASWNFEYEGRSGEAVIAQPEPGVYHVLLDGRSYEVRVSGDRMDIDGEEISAVLVDPRDAVARGETGAVQGRQLITAPMPGKVVRLLVSDGDTVERGDGIVVIEAMKMQNELKSPKAGRVTSLAAVEGATVGPGEVLAVVE